ncbi:MAG: transcription termination factor Rho [Gemmatimonadota bacterium]|nr:transcription termination factor Rho [Gemmatimonadota bacterium]MDE2870506.1 transcription termination factor Rho [Gemmatimonadota bacterium]
MEIAELKNRTVAELHGYAEALNIQHYAGLRKQDLIFTIYQGLLGQNETPRAEGVLDILPDGHGFLRSPDWHYVSGPDDPHVSRAHIESYGLRKGDVLAGPVRPPASGERHLALVSVDHVNGDRPESARQRACFEAMRPRYPDERFTLEVPGGDVAMRMMDLIAPVGMGQRGLIVSPPRAGKTTILRNIANAISTNHPETGLFVLLIDERPEEVTEMRESTKGEVVSSTFDEPALRHRHVAEMVNHKAKRMVERGEDVVILLDSITRLARAYNSLAPHSGRILSGGVDANALAHPKRFFGSARSLQWGGSLTIIATALIDTGSRMDEVIFEEFKGTGNMELVLDREIADHRIFPAIDLNRSGTRREELLLTETELNRVFVLRNFLSAMPPPEAIRFLMERMEGHRTNADFLRAMAQGV